MTVEELGQRMSAAELNEWIAFAGLEPLPDPWLQTGIACAVIANGNPYRKGPALKATDFMPATRTPLVEQTPAQQEQAFRRLGAELNAILGARR
jgi:hypothetical protein